MISTATTLSSTDRLPLLILYLLFAMPVFPPLASSILLFLFLLSSIFSFAKRKKRTFLSFFFLLSAGLFFAYLWSLTYTSNMQYGFKKISTALSLIILPLSFSTFSKEQLNYCRSRLKDYLKVYINAVGILILTCLIPLLADYGLDELFDESKGFYNNLNILNGMDTLYLSFHTSIAVLFSTYLFYISRKLWNAFFALILVVLFFTILFFLAFKASLIPALLSFGILSILTNKLRLWILFGAGLTLLITMVIFSSQINERFSQLLIVKNTIVNNTDFENVRSNTYNCSIELLPDAGFFGFGIGDGKNELNKCFDSIDSKLSSVSYNTHNQYFSIVTNVGFLGLIIFLGSLFIQSIISLNRKNYLAVTMVVLFTVWMFAENILERQGGVMYFSLFTSFLFVLNFKSPVEDKIVLSHERVMDSLNR